MSELKPQKGECACETTIAALAISVKMLLIVANTVLLKCIKFWCKYILYKLLCQHFF